jgi:glycosyltransferase involved in cell wall biosynthesis
MRVIHVIPRINIETGGPAYSVPNLCRALVEAGAEVELHATQGIVPSGMPFHSYFHGEWSWPPQLGISPAIHRALKERIGKIDILHNNCLWCMANVYTGLVARGKPCRLVTSPRGTFAPWALQRSYWRKRLMWWAGQARTVMTSHCLHATSENELLEIRQQGLRQPVAVIPNGIEIDFEPTAIDPSPRRQLLFLSRIHPKKGVDILLEAWREVQDDVPEWELKIVGPDNEGYRVKCEDLAARLGTERVRFDGPVYGKDKNAAFRQADLYVLPTHSENFGMTVAEALAHGVPAIVTHGAPWEGLEKNECGWWIEIGKGPLVECMRHALRLSREELKIRGDRGREWMERDFGWPRIGRMMYDTYTWLLGGGPPPAYVDTV